MGQILASAILDKVAKTLMDINATKWNRAELLGWLNTGQRAIAVKDPTAANKTTSVLMAAGARQTIPTGGWVLLDVYCNMGTAPGTTPGPAVRMVSRKLLDAFRPSWRTDTAVTAVNNWLFDPQDQTAFWVYPPSDGTGYLQINYCALPADLSTEGQTILLSDAYEQPLIDWVLYRACQKSVDGSPGPEMAAKYFAAYEQGLADIMSGQAAQAPANAFDPTTPGGNET